MNGSNRRRPGILAGRFGVDRSLGADGLPDRLRRPDAAESVLHDRRRSISRPVRSSSSPRKRQGRKLSRKTRLCSSSGNVAGTLRVPSASSALGGRHTECACYFEYSPRSPTGTQGTPGGLPKRCVRGRTWLVGGSSGDGASDC